VFVIEKYNKKDCKMGDVLEEDKGNVFIKKIYDKNLGREVVEQIILKDMKCNDRKDVIQSYIITAAKYDFSVYEKRILFRVVECFQSFLEGQKLDENFSMTQGVYGIKISLPLSSLLVGENDNNHNKIKNAFLSLMKKEILYEDNKVWKACTMVIAPEMIKYDRTVTFCLHQMVYEALMDFSKGYRKYELDVALSFNSIYSARLYEIVSGQTNSLTYSIDCLKGMFKLENKYRNVNDFVSYVIKPSKQELDLKAPYSFIYQMEYEKVRDPLKRGRKKIIGITFIPIYHYSNRDKKLACNDIHRNIDLTKILVADELSVFFSFGFSEGDLKSKYYNLIYDISLAKKQGVIIINSAIIEYAQRARSPKTYFIKSLKRELNKFKDEMFSKQKFDEIILLKNSVSTDCIEREELSVYSFLKNHLGFSDRMLEKITKYVIMKGGTKYLNNLLKICGDNCDNLSVSITNELKMYELAHKHFFVKKSKQFDIKQKTVLEDHSTLSKVDFTVIPRKSKLISVNKSSKNVVKQQIIVPILKKHIQKKLKENWKMIVIKNLSFMEKVEYIIRLCNEKFLIKKADEKNIVIHVDY
jgi:plasmid replication initiation protein